MSRRTPSIKARKSSRSPKRASKRSAKPSKLVKVGKNALPRAYLTRAEAIEHGTTQASAKLVKLLKRSVTLVREIRKLAKLLGVTVPKVTIKVKR